MMTGMRARDRPLPPNAVGTGREPGDPSPKMALVRTRQPLRYLSNIRYLSNMPSAGLYPLADLGEDIFSFAGRLRTRLR